MTMAMEHSDAVKKNRFIGINELLEPMDDI